MASQQPVLIYSNESLDEHVAPPLSMPGNIALLNAAFNRLYTERYDLFYRLFIVGEAIEYKEPDIDFNVYLGNGICLQKDALVQSKYMVDKICGVFILTDFPHYRGEDRVLYLADDETGYVANALPDCTDYSVLDIGTGSGVLSIIACIRGAKHVTALDVNKRAEAFARFNTALNGCQDLISFVMQPVAEFRAQRKYDFIVSNPPFIATPSDGQYRKSGAAGFDGLNIMRDILNRLDEFMHPHSSFMMNILSPGDDLLSEIEKLVLAKYRSQRKKITCTEIYGCAHDVDIIFTPFEGEQDLSQWKKQIAEKGYTHIHSVLLEMEPDLHRSSQHPVLEKTEVYGSWEAKYHDIRISREFT